MLDVVSGNKVRDAALRSIWESYRTKAAQSSEKLRNTTICVCSTHPSAYFGVSFLGRGRGNDHGVLLRACDPVDMYSPGDPDLEQMDHLRAALRHLKTQRDHSAAQRATFPLRGTASEWDGLRIDSRPDLVLKLGVMPIPITSLSSVIIPVLAPADGFSPEGDIFVDGRNIIIHLQLNQNGWVTQPGVPQRPGYGAAVTRL
jgi:hypothetical protein